MRFLFVTVFVFIACQPVVSWACMVGMGDYRNYQAKESDTCYKITDGKHENLCTESIRVFFDSNSIYIDPETDPTPFGQPYGPVLAPGEIIEETPTRIECYPDACKEELTLVVGSPEEPIDENYKDNEKLTVYTYTYEVQSDEPCNNEEPDPQVNQPMPPPTPQPKPLQSSDDEDGGCSSTPSNPPSPIGLMGLFGLMLFGWVRRVNSKV